MKNRKSKRLENGWDLLTIIVCVIVALFNMPFNGRRTQFAHSAPAPLPAAAREPAVFNTEKSHDSRANPHFSGDSRGENMPLPNAPPIQIPNPKVTKTFPAIKNVPLRETPSSGRPSPRAAGILTGPPEPAQNGLGTQTDASSNLAIHQRLEEEIASDSTLKGVKELDINVTATDIMLKGPVPTEKQRRRIASIARRISPDRVIQNNLTVSSGNKNKRK